MVGWPRRIGLMLAVVVLASLSAAPSAQACAVCFGDPESPMTKGALWGVAVMAGVIGSVLFCIAGTGLFWIHRSRELARTDAPED